VKQLAAASASRWTAPPPRQRISALVHALQVPRMWEKRERRRKARERTANETNEGATEHFACQFSCLARCYLQATLGA